MFPCLQEPKLEKISASRGNIIITVNLSRLLYIEIYICSCIQVFDELMRSVGKSSSVDEVSGFAKKWKTIQCNLLSTLHWTQERM